VRVGIEFADEGVFVNACTVSLAPQRFNLTVNVVCSAQRAKGP
jgi:hypothetical protein